MPAERSVSGFVYRARLVDDGAGVQGERPYAVVLLALVERDREQDVRRLRLPVRRERLVLAMREVQVVECTSEYRCPRDETDTTRAPWACRSAGSSRVVSWKCPRWLVANCDS